MKRIHIAFVSVSLLAASCGGGEETLPTNNSQESISTTETCPHCSGLGRRVNQITGQMGDCSSCDGDGQVSSDQYNRLSK